MTPMIRPGLRLDKLEVSVEGTLEPAGVVREYWPFGPIVSVVVGARTWPPILVQLFSRVASSFENDALTGVEIVPPVVVLGNARIASCVGVKPDEVPDARGRF